MNSLANLDGLWEVGKPRQKVFKIRTRGLSVISVQSNCKYLSPYCTPLLSTCTPIQTFKDYLWAHNNFRAVPARSYEGLSKQ